MWTISFLNSQKNKTFGSAHDILVLFALISSEGSDKPAYMGIVSPEALLLAYTMYVVDKGADQNLDR